VGLDFAIMYTSSIFHSKFVVDPQTLALADQTKADIEDEYDKTNNQISQIRPLSLNETKDRTIGDKFCNSDRCEIRF